MSTTPHTDRPEVGNQNSTREAALEVLARELYVRREAMTRAFNNDAATRRSCYRHTTPSQQDEYLRHARMLLDSLGESGLTLAWQEA